MPPLAWGWSALQTGDYLGIAYPPWRLVRGFCVGTFTTTYGVIGQTAARQRQVSTWNSICSQSTAPAT
jgi:hypothetical protein